MQFTYGEWVADGLCIRTKGLHPLWIAQMCATKPTEEDFANAKVMAQSKQMYDVLKNLQKSPSFEYLKQGDQAMVRSVISKVEE